MAHDLFVPVDVWETRVVGFLSLFISYPVFPRNLMVFFSLLSQVPVNIDARIVGVSVPALTVTICLHFIKQEEGEDLAVPRTQGKQQPAVTWACTNRKLF